MGVRSFVPALLLRLGRDQECYDFVKWYATTGDEGDYDWGDMDQPFLDVKDADMLESPEYLCKGYTDLSLLVSITLLKVRLLLPVLADSNGWEETLRSSPTFNQIHDKVVRNAATGGQETKSDEVTQMLRFQLNQLYQAVNVANPYFWKALLNPGRHLDTHPAFFSHGSQEQMQMELKHSYDGWKESPGAIELINENYHN